MIRTVIINLIIIASLFSQDTSSVRIGFKGGLNFSFIPTLNNQHSGFGSLNNANRKLGFNLGVILDRETNSPTAYQVELFYNETGSKWGQPLIGFLIPYDGDYVIYELKYITISAYFKLKSRIGNLIKDFDFVIGASYSYNISTRQEWVVEYSNYDFIVGPPDIQSEINRHEFGIVYGIKFPFKNRHFYLSFLFYNALTTLYPDTYSQYKDDFKYKYKMRNNTFSICFDVFI